MPHARRNGRACFVVGGAGMADRHAMSGGDEAANQVHAARQFRRERDDAGGGTVTRNHREDVGGAEVTLGGLTGRRD